MLSIPWKTCQPKPLPAIVPACYRRARALPRRPPLRAVLPRHYAAPEAAAAEGADHLRLSPFSRPLGRARSTAHKGRRALRSTAPENSPKTPDNSPKTKFSTVWKKCFHCVEKRRNVFPLCGKIAKTFSIVWKKWACFSTVWKIFFHSVEKSRKCFPDCGKLLATMACL